MIDRIVMWPRALAISFWVRPVEHGRNSIRCNFMKIPSKIEGGQGGLPPWDASPSGGERGSPSQLLLREKGFLLSKKINAGKIWQIISSSRGFLKKNKNRGKKQEKKCSSYPASISGNLFQVEIEDIVPHAQSRPGYHHPGRERDEMLQGERSLFLHLVATRIPCLLLLVVAGNLQGCFVEETDGYACIAGARGQVYRDGNPVVLFGDLGVRVVQGAAHDGCGIPREPLRLIRGFKSKLVQVVHGCPEFIELIIDRSAITSYHLSAPPVCCPGVIPPGYRDGGCVHEYRFWQRNLRIWQAGKNALKQKENQKKIICTGFSAASRSAA
eukprot:TRINITY_DN23265_c0_g1_i1.p1 TRINITY_DN23265_c0_g1~~TRINITY_DN23265_c0_g1_i1.p1  ORF type:complete len:327 (+),score=-45.62 TRINITY_DN23265_c0_g1_i1:234-1214(+)